MWGLVEAFPDQCRRALAIAREVSFPAPKTAPTSAILTGMGGSASGGDFARALFEAHGAIPFSVNRDYRLPNFVGPGTIIFAASYSGNTEETLACYDQAQAAGASIVAVTSGGKLKERAERDGHPIVLVPGGQPPRSALGFMLIPVLVACEAMGLLPAHDFEGAFAALEACANGYAPGGDDPRPRELAQAFRGKLPILYGVGTWPGLIANRWKCQINENAKCHAFYHAYPELDHNEILGWIEAKGQGIAGFHGAALSASSEGQGESPKMRTRREVTERLIGPQCPFTRVEAKGDDLLTQMLTLTYFGDFVSMYLSALNGVDPTVIPHIETLKAELEKVA